MAALATLQTRANTQEARASIVVGRVCTLAQTLTLTASWKRGRHSALVAQEVRELVREHGCQEDLRWLEEQHATFM